VLSGIATFLRSRSNGLKSQEKNRGNYESSYRKPTELCQEGLSFYYGRGGGRGACGDWRHESRGQPGAVATTAAITATGCCCDFQGYGFYRGCGFYARPIQARVRADCAQRMPLYQECEIKGADRVRLRSSRRSDFGHARMGQHPGI